MLLAIPAPDTTDDAMYWRRDFPGRTDQVRAVRAFAAHLLTGLPVLDDVLLVLDELSVNAIRHTRSGSSGGRFTVHIGKDLAGVVVCVDDQGGPGEPSVRDVDEWAEGGRGLLTVAALAATWSWRGNEHARTVRATFPTPHPTRMSRS
ncbi:ATP-binding protein [Spirillospora albida]|uniref:ATP-binding protein n=1 Tax=Spirillospora albida TaxID=58123 RepID=UPI00069117CD|nr:ATP-binding protein [Spirillospora albida]